MDDKSMKPVQPESESSAENSDDDIAPEIEEILNDLPAPKRKEIRQVVSTVSMYGRFSPENSVAKKITEEHITRMLDTQEKGMEYTYKENQHKMIVGVVILALSLIAVIVIIAMLKDNNSEAMTQILTALISATLGFAGGYGLGTNKKKDDE